MGKKKLDNDIVDENESEDVEGINISPEQIQAVVNRAQSFKQKVAKYPDELKILAITMVAAGQTHKEVGLKLGVSSSVVGNWVNDPNLDEVLLNDMSGSLKRRLASKMYISANTALSRVSDEDYEKASLLQKGTFAAVMIDKGRLLDGETTENIGMVYNRGKKMSTQREVVDVEYRNTEAKLAELKQGLNQ